MVSCRVCMAYDHIDGVRGVIKVSIVIAVFGWVFAKIRINRVLVGQIQVNQLVLLTVVF